MNFTIHQLQVFLNVIRHNSITKAAEEMHLTQPAVSIQLRNLQDQFEVPIIEIIGRKVYITEFGKEIADSAEMIIGEVNAINSKAAAYKGKLVGKLKITVVSTGKYIIPSFLSDFMKLYPGIELVLDVTNRARVIKSLEKNEVDFALVSLLPEHLNVEEIELMDNKLYLVGSKNHNLEQRMGSEKIFSEIPLIFREQGSGTRSIMEKFIKQHNFPAVKKMELTSNEAVKQAVLADLGFSIMPLIGIRNEIRNGSLKIIEVKGFPIRSKWKMIWLKNKALSPVAVAYQKYVMKEKSRIIKEKFEDSM